MSTQTVPRHSLEEHQGSNNATCGPARYVRFGTFQLDLEKEELFKNGARVKLQSRSVRRSWRCFLSRAKS